MRTVETDSTAMAPIHLRLGASTVLRFPDKPKKVVLGNSNYYSVEFIDVYGFLLSTGNSGAYDDLVRVKWKDEKAGMLSGTLSDSSPIREVSAPNLRFLVGSRLSVLISKISRYQGKDFYVIDFSIRNASTEALSLDGVRVDARTAKSKPLHSQFVIKKNDLDSGEKTAARLMVTVPKTKRLQINVCFEAKCVSQSILKKML